MFEIDYTATATVNIIYDCNFSYTMVGSLSIISDTVCQHMREHNFSYADVCDSETGEILITIRKEG